MPFHKLFGHPQANTGAQISLRCKERLEYFANVVTPDALSRITHNHVKRFLLCPPRLVDGDR